MAIKFEGDVGDEAVKNDIRATNSAR